MVVLLTLDLSDAARAATSGRSSKRSIAGPAGTGPKAASRASFATSKASFSSWRDPIARRLRNLVAARLAVLRADGARRSGWCSGPSASRSRSGARCSSRPSRGRPACSAALIPANLGALEASNVAVVRALGLAGAGSLALSRRVRGLFWAGLGLLLYPRDTLARTREESVADAVGDPRPRFRSGPAALGGVGLFIVAALDSSFLSFPQVNDLLIIYLSTKTPR